MDQNFEEINCTTCKRSSVCFKHLVESELEFINEHKVQIHYSKGETLVKKGAFATSILYVLEGLVRVYLEGPDNRNIIIKILIPGDYIGLSSLFGESIYNFSAKALSDSIVCSINKESFGDLISKNGVFASEIIKWYCANYNHMFEKCQSLGMKQLHGRLADSLIYLNREEFKSLNVLSYLSRKDIAEFAGMSIESAVRILSEFNDDKIIKINGKMIEIINLELLIKISRSG